MKLYAEQLEDRITPSVGYSLNGGALTVTLNATNDVAELRGISTSGNQFYLYGDASYITTLSSVTSVSVQGSGSAANQTVIFDTSGEPSNVQINLTGALSITNVYGTQFQTTAQPVQASSFSESSDSYSYVAFLGTGELYTTGSAGQSFGGYVYLNNQVFFAAYAGAGNVVFHSPVDNWFSSTPEALFVDTTGAVYFYGGVGNSSAPLASVNSYYESNNNYSTTYLESGSVYTTGYQEYYTLYLGNGDAATLESTGSGNLYFEGNIYALSNGSPSLFAYTGGNINFYGDVGTSAALSYLETNGGGVTDIFGGAVDTTLNQSYGGYVYLYGSTTFSGNYVYFDSIVSGVASGSQSLTASANVYFYGPVGLTPLSSVLINTGYFTYLQGVNVATTGAQSYNGHVELTGSNSLTSTSSGNITFGSAVDSSSAPASLTVNTGGNSTFSGAVGAITPLQNLSVTTGTMSAGAIATTSGATIIDSGAGDISGMISGSGASFTKQGAGTLTLGGGNSYGGTTTISGGTLELDGSLAAGSAVTVQSGGKLDGTGTVNGSVTAQSGSTVSPGHSPGILGTGNLALNSASTFNMQLNGTTAGTQYSQDNVTGSVNLDADSGSGANLNVTLGYAPARGDQFTIINNDLTDPVTGTFAGLPQGAILSAGYNGMTYLFSVNYAGGDGNDVVLSVVPPSVNSSTASLPDSSTSLTINGSYFDTNAAHDTVTFSNGVIGTVTTATATQLTVAITTPPTALGGLTAVVSADGVSSGSAVQVANVVWDSVVTRLSPDSATEVGTLRYALSNVQTGVPVTFESDLSGGTITLSSTLAVGTNVTITGLGAGNLAISGNNAVEVFNIASGVTASMSSLTIENGVAAGTGGGICNLGTLALRNDTISGNSANYGGGVANDNGMLTFSNSTLSSNSANESGGGVWNSGGTMTLSNSTISGNSSYHGFGGGIYNNSGSSITLSNSTISSNSAYGSGGGIDNYSGTLTVSNSNFTGNSAHAGGAISTMGALTVSGATISGNFAELGGGILSDVSTSSAAVSNSTISGNTAALGGGIFISSASSLTLTNLTVSSNSAHDSGGGILNEGTLTVSNSTLSGNSVNHSGGGIYANGGALTTVNNSTLSGNSAHNNGGAVYNYFGALTLSNSTVSGNSAAVNGGGIFSYMG